MKLGHGRIYGDVPPIKGVYRGAGPDAEWVGADPTNRKLAGEEHVKIGHGRFYGDVAPIRGVYKGAAATSEHEVNVKMTRFTK